MGEQWWLAGYMGFYECVTRRRQNKPSSTQKPSEKSTYQKATARSHVELTVPTLLVLGDQTPSRSTDAKVTTHSPTQTESNKSTHRACIQGCDLYYCVLIRPCRLSLSLFCNLVLRYVNQGQCKLHGDSAKRLAPPRHTKDRKHLQSTQTTVNRHNPQTKHQAPSKEQPKSKVA